MDRDLTPTIVNLTLTDADSQYSTELPAKAKHFSFQCRTAVDVRFAFETGKVATPTAPYATLKSGASFSAPEKYMNALARTLYFASASAGSIVEIVYWL